MRNPALDAWGDYDRDDPYPLFAQVRSDGPVHEVTLADGHRAWLIIRNEEAKTALKELKLLNPSLTFVESNLRRLYNDQTAIDHILDGLRTAGFD